VGDLDGDERVDFVVNDLDAPAQVIATAGGDGQ
jgi:hypothetical protein